MLTRVRFWPIADYRKLNACNNLLYFTSQFSWPIAGALYGFDDEHPRLLGFLTVGLDRLVPLGIVEG
jgi:hypothetical protein